VGKDAGSWRRLIGRQSREIATTQITLICMGAGLSDLERKTVQNGGSRATGAASDYHTARLAFQSVSEPIAEGCGSFGGRSKATLSDWPWVVAG
jgi:hypothetical protein